jgi:hypothetical protein
MNPTTRLWIKRCIKVGEFLEMHLSGTWRVIKNFFLVALMPLVGFGTIAAMFYFMNYALNTKYENASLDAISNLVNSSECAKREVLIINRAGRVVRNYDVESIKKECKSLAIAKVALENQNKLLSPLKD